MAGVCLAKVILCLVPITRAERSFPGSITPKNLETIVCLGELMALLACVLLIAIRTMPPSPVRWPTLASVLALTASRCDNSL
ncbi:hypothetical protein QBC40DRAFT_282779 [Triangularia verruculosa]|uniref:Uncharacterized protein n=1 Tax=Triangularia verruculosa TaxID=2587418 RepID=A0AAN7AS31_9PEZI|nr:hypothetical protein QBC40DRAFT_282779 [Triangularia verruculosa]